MNNSNVAGSRLFKRKDGGNSAWCYTPQAKWHCRRREKVLRNGALAGYSAFSDAISMEKRYFTSDLSSRS